jgi:sporulation protein YlmC with PRC-barrel domain
MGKHGLLAAILCVILAAPSFAQAPIPSAPAPREGVIAAIVDVAVAPAYAQPPIPAAPAPRVSANVASSASVVSPAMDAGAGIRTSKVLGAAIYDDQDVKIGTIDDLIVGPQERATIAVLSVGEFLGVGTKLVSVPLDEIRQVEGKMILAKSSKDSLSDLPAFRYTR